MYICRNKFLNKLYHEKVFFIATLLVAGVMSAKSTSNEMLKNMTSKVKVKKVSKSDKRLITSGCIRTYYHGCTHATACLSSIEKAIEWAEKIHENYCSN